MTEFTPEAALANAEEIFLSRYKGAEFCVATGSIIQGIGTQYSDLDLIVVFSKNCSGLS